MAGPEVAARSRRRPGGGARAAAVTAVSVTAVSAVAAVLAVGGCGRISQAVHGGPRTVAPDAALSAQCSTVPAGASRVTLTGPGGARLGAAVLGPGTGGTAGTAPPAGTVGTAGTAGTAGGTGVVLDQGASQTLCDWLPFAARLASATGARVLVLDRRGSGSSPGYYDLRTEPGDVVTAADWLSAHGSSRLVLLGSSLGTIATVLASSSGGPAAVAAGAATRHLTRSPCATVAVSPHLESQATAAGSGPGAVEVSALSAPTAARSVWLTWEQGNPSVAAEAGQVRAWAGSHGADVHVHAVAGTTDHSIALVEDHRDVEAFLTAAVRSCR